MKPKINFELGKPDKFSTNWLVTNASNEAKASPVYFSKLGMFEYIYLFNWQTPLFKERNSSRIKKNKKS